MRALRTTPVPSSLKTPAYVFLDMLKYLSVLAIAASGALYAAPIARQVPELITGEDNKIAGYTIASLAAFGKMMIYAMQYLSILAAISKIRNNSRESHSALKITGISVLAVSTMLAAFLLAVIQLRESAVDYRNLQYPIAIFAALNEGIEVGLSFTVLAYISLAIRYLLGKKINPEKVGLINGDPDSDLVFTGSVFPGRLATFSSLVPAVLSLTVLTGCILDEYFRTLPGEINPILAYTLSALGVPGVIFIGLLGLGSFSQLLENRSGFKDLNKFLLFLTFVFSAAAASMEFKLGTEAARGNYPLAMTLGSVNVMGQVIITQTYMYQGLDNILKALTSVVSACTNGMRNTMGCPAPASASPASVPA